MANIDDNAGTTQDLPTPTVLRNERGDSIVPTAVPPTTQFQDFPGRTEARNEESRQAQLSQTPKEIAQDLEAQPDLVRDMTPVGKSVTEDVHHNGSPVSAPKRAGTTPVDGAAGMRGPQRTSSFLTGMKRRRTNTQPNMSSRNPFEYTFEPVSSDSDSSMSSDDDEEPLKDQPVQVGAQVGDEKGTSRGQEDGLQKSESKAYSNSRFAIGNGFFKTKGRVSRRDGRLKISINETANSGYIAKALGRSIRNHLDIPSEKNESPEARKKKAELEEDEAKSIQSAIYEAVPKPKLNIVIMVIGSRGDIQPFLKIGKVLKHDHGHRVRIASHPTFRDFVEKDAGLEFFSVGGDPSELMAFMVKNPGLIPSMQTFWEGEIGKRRASMAEMFEGFWRACINTTEHEHDKANLKHMSEKEPFIADAIIANPPCMAHVHIAERLGIPLHMMFTFPYSPTIQFPHPLANIKVRKSNVDAGYVNFMSYPVRILSKQAIELLLHADPQVAC